MMMCLSSRIQETLSNADLVPSLDQNFWLAVQPQRRSTSPTILCILFGNKINLVLHCHIILRLRYYQTCDLICARYMRLLIMKERLLMYHIFFPFPHHAHSPIQILHPSFLTETNIYASSLTIPPNLNNLFFSLHFFFCCNSHWHNEWAVLDWRHHSREPILRVLFQLHRRNRAGTVHGSQPRARRKEHSERL